VSGLHLSRKWKLYLTIYWIFRKPSLIGETAYYRKRQLERTVGPNSSTYCQIVIKFCKQQHMRPLLILCLSKINVTFITPHHAKTTAMQIISPPFNKQVQINSSFKFTRYKRLGKGRNQMHKQYDLLMFNRSFMYINLKFRNILFQI